MSAYYNENDPRMAAVLRVLIDRGHIARGIVDERSVSDVKPSDLSGYVQCHFFAGVGVWSHALRLAGWPDDRPVWTGSCPCQPFSGAGKGLGFADERHLWPDWHHLIRECGPASVLGEQVADNGGFLWLDLVSSDMEGTGYAIGAVASPAACVGAPHMRHRIYFGARKLADTNGNGRNQGRAGDAATGGNGAFRDGAHGRLLGHAFLARLEGYRRDGDRGCQPGRIDPFKAGPITTASAVVRPGPVNGFWRDADWLFGRDGKWRAVGPGTFPLADGATARVGRLHGYGNAIVAQHAQAFIEAVMQCA